MSTSTKRTAIAPRLLSNKELIQYTGLGKTKAREWAEAIGAVRRIGTRVLYDKRVIDAALDAKMEGGGNDS